MIWELYDKLVQLFCLHDWAVVSTKAMEQDGHYIRIRTKCQCRKCGKVRYV